ncbi:MAG: hypothetical protein LLG01_05795 [Planctomycetaceae bacterium]|nr:hypothetical protein [Planctomycetaceae bacterium]
MNYWLDLFTGTTWEEFKKAGSKTSGFRHRMRNAVARMQPGDILLCYLTGVMRWVGALEVTGPSTDSSPIWSVADFPQRVAVKPVIQLQPETGIPMEQLEGRVSFYTGPKDRGKFKGFIRRSPNLMVKTDAELVIALLREAEKKPVARPVDPAKLARKPFLKVETKKGKQVVETIVAVPETEELETTVSSVAGTSNADRSTDHVAVQHLLLDVGAKMGFDVWVARNDRGRTYNGALLGDMPGVIDRLPTQFNEATNKTIELIDTLWLKGNSIIAAFEIECTTSVYSGLLRMSDLLALQPNLNISLYIVAPEERRAKVEQEMLRPTFKLRQSPLAETCALLPIEDLIEKVQGVQKLGLLSVLKPEFLDEIAHYFSEDDGD